MSTLPSPPFPTRGFDVSEYSTSKVDFWNQNVNGAIFVIARATVDLTHVDSLFELHCKKAKDASLILGSYHAFFANHDPEAQARFYLNTISDVTDMPPMVDFELMHGTDPCEAVIKVLEFVKAVEGECQKPVFVYTYPYFIDMILDEIVRRGDGNASDALFLLAKRPLAIAHYKVPKPRIPRPWKEWTIWQCAGNVSDSGGIVDVDYWKDS